MTRYEKLKELIAADDFDMFALWVAITADRIKGACPAVCCTISIVPFPTRATMFECVATCF